MTVECCPDVLTAVVRPRRTVLVFGTTAAGLMAAGELLSKNLEVILVDRTPSWRIANPDDETFAALCRQISSNPNAKIFFEADMTELTGRPGNYGITLRTPHGQKTMMVGGILFCLAHNSQWAVDLLSKISSLRNTGGTCLQAAAKPSAAQNRSAGIWFAVASGANHGLKVESNSVQQAVLALSELLDMPRIEIAPAMDNAL